MKSIVVSLLAFCATILQPENGGTRYLQLTNLAGSATHTDEYDPFGYLLASTGTTPNSYLYRGEQYHSNLGIYYLRARYYSPVTGRFLSRDPKEFKPLESRNKPVASRKLHRYLYAVGDPVNRIDPRGREDEEEEGGIISYIAVDVRTVQELKDFAGAVGCAFVIEAYLISLRDGGNLLDNTLGGAGTAGGCALLFWQ